MRFSSRIRSAGIFVAVLAAIALWPSAVLHAGPAQVQISGTIRDFRGLFDVNGNLNPGGHQHFEQFDFSSKPILGGDPLGIVAYPGRHPVEFFKNVVKINGVDYVTGGVDQGNKRELNIVQSALGADGKPVWRGGTANNLFHTTQTKVNATNDGVIEVNDPVYHAARFNEWFNDVNGVNQSDSFAMTLENDGNDVYKFKNDAFYPLDGQMFGNEGRAHNQNFTLELHDKPIWDGGGFVKLGGDDDIWLFINGKLAIDVGGIHQDIAREIDLAAMAAQFGLVSGEAFDFDLFYADRNGRFASLRLETTLQFGGTSTVIPLPPAIWQAFSVVGLGVLGCGLARIRRMFK